MSSFENLAKNGIRIFFLISDNCFYFDYNGEHWRAEQYSENGWDFHVVPWIEGEES